MYYQLNRQQEDALLRAPETGMGYQIIQGVIRSTNKVENFMVLNSEIIIELNGYEKQYMRAIFSEGIKNIKAKATFLPFDLLKVYNERQYRSSILNESKGSKENAAIENPVERANGAEVFVRLSAFDDDKRVDKINKCLLPGSFTTTFDDYFICKNTKDDPVERYALPNDDKIKWAFYIKPVNADTLQRGRVQPANNKRGGGKEVYFEKGTSNGTYFLQTAY